MGKKRARLAKALRARKTTRTISSLIGLTAFIEQITTKDRDQYSSLPYMKKAEAVINNITGRMFNFNIFNGVPKFSMELHPENIANKWTGIGLGLIVAEMLSKAIVQPMTGKKIPMLTKVAGLGKYLLPAGILGGLFDSAGATTASRGSTSYNFNSNKLMESTT